MSDLALSCNLRWWERAARILLGLIGLFFLMAGPQSGWGLLGFLPLLTGIVGFCPLWALFRRRPG